VKQSDSRCPFAIVLTAKRIWFNFIEIHISSLGFLRWFGTTLGSHSNAVAHRMLNRQIVEIDSPMLQAVNPVSGATLIGSGLVPRQHNRLAGPSPLAVGLARTT
jgi:hypothetical protein